MFTSRDHSLVRALPLVDGVRVLEYDPVHPGQGMGQQQLPLEEAHVTTVASQGEDHVG